MEAEGEDNLPFGLERALDVVKRHSKTSAGEIMQGLYEEVRHYLGVRPQEDDITSIICKVS